MTPIHSPFDARPRSATPAAAQARGEARDVIVIGAALGGLTALCKIASGLPRDFDAAVLVALDLASQPVSTVLQILDTYSPIPVEYAHHRAFVRKRRIVRSPLHTDMRIAREAIAQAA